MTDKLMTVHDLAWSTSTGDSNPQFPCVFQTVMTRGNEQGDATNTHSLHLQQQLQPQAIRAGGRNKHQRQDNVPTHIFTPRTYQVRTATAPAFTFCAHAFIDTVPIIYARVQNRQFQIGVSLAV